MDQKVAILQARFPNLGVTYGYIGNCGVDRRGPFDDRSWRIFTNRRSHDGRSISVHLDGPNFDVDKVSVLLNRYQFIGIGP